MMIKSLHQQCTAMGLTISCRKTQTLTVLPSSSCLQPQSILLSPSCSAHPAQPILLSPSCSAHPADPVEPVTTFQYLGSTVFQDCQSLTGFWLAQPQAVESEEDQYHYQPPCLLFCHPFCHPFNPPIWIKVHCLA